MIRRHLFIFDIIFLILLSAVLFLNFALFLFLFQKKKREKERERERERHSNSFSGIDFLSRKYE